MSAAITEQVAAVLLAGRLAHLVTLNPDGSPQVSLVWVGIDGNQIVSGHMSAWRKVQNLQRDPRVALSMEAEGRNERGLDHYLVVHGTGRGGRRRGRPAAAAAGRRLPRARGEVPTGRRPVAGLRGQDHARPLRRCRSVGGLTGARAGGPAGTDWISRRRPPRRRPGGDRSARPTRCGR